MCCTFPIFRFRQLRHFAGGTASGGFPSLALLCVAISDRRATLAFWWSPSPTHVWGFCNCAACSVSLRRFSAAPWTPCRARV